MKPLNHSCSGNISCQRCSVRLLEMGIASRFGPSFVYAFELCLDLDLQAIRMVQFILKNFAQDEEIQTIHLPIIFGAILDIVDVSQQLVYTFLLLNIPQLQVQANPTKASSKLVRECLLLQEEMLRHIPHSSLMQRPELTGSIEVKRTTQRPYLFACSFYGITPVAAYAAPDGSFAIPFTSAFENLIELSLNCANSLIQGSENVVVLREVFSQSLLLIDRLVGRLGTSVKVEWNPATWLYMLLRTIDHEV